jgi:LysR family glycine cleavage system transcriptional activator
VKVRSNTPLIALKTFEVAARRKSFAAAAEELFVTPAAVSHQVKRLEDHLKVQLFLRHNRCVVLTEAGRALAEKLHTVFSLLEDALQQMVDVSHEVVRISALPSFAAKWLAPRLHRFEADHPQIRIRIEANDRLANFINDEIDLAIRYGAGDYANSSAERLLDAPAFPVCTPALAQGGRPLRDPLDLASYVLLHDETWKQSAGVPNWTQWLEAAQVTVVSTDRGPIFDSLHLALEAATAGHGIALGIAPLVEEDLRAGRLVRPFDLAIANAYAFYVVLPAAGPRNANVQRFLDWLRSEARATPSRSGR